AIPLRGLTRGSCEGWESYAHCRDSRTRFWQSDRDRRRPKDGRSSHYQSARLSHYGTAGPNRSGNTARGYQVTHPRNSISIQNPKAAAAQYRQARAVLRYYRADYYPTATLGLSATRTRVSAHRPPPSSIFDGITYNDFALPVDFSYQADVWGRVRRNVESYREQAQASAADLATVNLSMHAELAIDYFLARSLDAEEQLLNSTVKQYEQALE